MTDNNDSAEDVEMKMLPQSDSTKAGKYFILKIDSFIYARIKECCYILY